MVKKKQAAPTIKRNQKKKSIEFKTESKSSVRLPLAKTTKIEEDVGNFRPSISVKTSRFPVVGIGSSAGGLEAFNQLLSHLPIDTGMAFVLIQHLDPKHESMSAEIFSRATKMKVAEVREGIRVEPNCVYVIPSNFRLEIKGGVLKLSPRTEDHGQHLVIDFFLQSLAKDLNSRAIGVILSGTGSDGTQGLNAIKAEGGITIAQAPSTAKFDGMPTSAIQSGVVDLVLDPVKMGEELTRIARHPYVVTSSKKKNGKELASPSELPEDGLARIFHLLNRFCHVDFALYKLNTIRRRIERRMILKRVDRLEAYAEFLSHNEDEVRALCSDLLINVTSFFRDAEAFSELRDEVFPKLIEGHGHGLPIRIWSVGCSTGEEAYSIVISLLEFLGEKASTTPIQIFGSDISENAIQMARLGEYPESISEHVSRDRLNKYFVRMEGGGYKVAKSIRNLCVFSRHNVVTDPPFAKMDLISCRNLLIYFTPSLQKHVIPLFHYALNPKGILWLGSSESISGFSDLFSTLDGINKIYLRKNAPVTLNLNFPSSTYISNQMASPSVIVPPSKVLMDNQAIVEKAIQATYPGVLVSDGMEIVQFRGRTDPFIVSSSGAPSTSLFKMANPEIISDLRRSIHEAKQRKTSIKKERLVLKEGRIVRTYNLRVIPIKPLQDEDRQFYLIHFEDVVEALNKRAITVSPSKIHANSSKKKDPYITELHQELTSNQDYQKTLIEKYENAQENLTAANEELQNANEELQSTNEELETAKEELQSGNEELSTVNEELHVRALDQAHTNDDLVNLLSSAQIPIVMLGIDQRVRRFTPMAGKVLNLLSTDVGRPLSDLKINFSTPGIDLSLKELISKVVDTMEPVEMEVQDHLNRWFRLQVRPYKTSEGKIDGSVLSIVDIDDLKKSFKEVNEARTLADKANRAKDLFLATLSHELRTPLTAILAWAQMIQSGKLDADTLKHAGQIIEESGKTQAGLIDDLLDVSRIILGKIDLNMSDVDPETIVMKSIESVKSLADKKFIRINTELEHQVGIVQGDPLRLKQIFSNLLTNAIKFSSLNSEISVKMHRSIGSSGQIAKIQIAVSDSGKGIGAAFLPKIFDSFSQEDSSSVRLHGGLGLGLAIVRSLVELHGGNVQAESPGEMLGATFTVTLPATSKRTTLDQGQQLQDNVIANLKGVQILVVEDEDSTREVLREVLQGFGAEVKTATSAPLGFEILKKYKPDVILTDISMPVESGYDLLSKIRSLDPSFGGGIPVIAVTALADMDEVKKAQSAGFQAHVSKPIDFNHLSNLILKVVKK